jgi:hypothetical protein
MIRDMEKFSTGFWNWGILAGCFGDTKIAPTDVDGCIERNGYKLIIETKLPGNKVPLGQARFLQSFVNDGHTVLLVWGQKDNPEKITVMTPTATIAYESATLGTLRSIVSSWFDYADSHVIGKHDPREAARTLLKNHGEAYVGRMIEEWTRIRREGERTN